MLSIPFSISNLSLHLLSANRKSTKDWLRYAIWLGVAGTANANRRESGLSTAWVPHLLGNSIALLLPEIYQHIEDTCGLDETFTPDRYPTLASLLACFKQVIADNPDYVDYVAPVAISYIVSHPRFNIYRGDWGEMRLAGFGLDSLPHSATAYALSTMLYDTIAALEHNATDPSLIQPLARWMAKHDRLVTAAALAGLTLLYELGEYRIHQSELAARDYDASQINMVWSARDTFFDVLSNTAGWLVATLSRTSGEDEEVQDSPLSNAIIY